jgi:hypothetical protein
VSKQWAEAIARFVNDQCAVLVPEAAYAASVAMYGDHEQQDALEWLLDKQHQQLEPDTMSQLLRTPGMPRGIIEAVMNTGASVNMQHLAAAGTFSKCWTPGMYVPTALFLSAVLCMNSRFLFHSATSNQAS